MTPKLRRDTGANTDLLVLHLLNQLVTLLLEDLGETRAAARIMQVATIPLSKLNNQPLPPTTRDPELARAYLRLRRIIRQLSQNPLAPASRNGLSHPSRTRGLGDGFTRGPGEHWGRKPSCTGRSPMRGCRRGKGKVKKRPR